MSDSERLVIVASALSVASSASTTIQLSASDSHIQIQPSVTIPSGTFTLEVPFAIGSNYNSSRVIALSAQFGTQTATINSYQTNRSLARFQFVPTFVTETVPPTGTTHDFEPFLVSIGGYTTIVSFSCQGLPVGATCLFGNTSLALPAGQEIANGLVIQTSANTPIGSYPIQVIATDGSVTDHLTVMLNVADFSVSVSPTSLNLVSGASANLSLTIGAVGQWTDAVGISCQTSPPNWVGCNETQGGFAPGTYTTQFSIFTNLGSPAGDYVVTIVGSAGGVTHDAPPVTVHVSGPPATNTTLGSSANPSVVGQSVTFTATVTNSVGTPSGTVNFLDSGIQIGAGALNANGQAPFTTATLAQGSHSIVASYAGTASFAASNSSAFTQTVNGAPDFSFSASPASQSVSPGQSTAYTLTLTPTNGFNQTVTISCSGTPAKASCTPVSSSVTLNGSSATQIQINVATTASSLALRWARVRCPSNLIGLLAFAGALCLLILWIAFHRDQRIRYFALCLFMIMLAVAVLGCAGGGGSGSGASNNGTPAGNYTLTMIGSSASGSHRATVTLIVN